MALDHILWAFSEKKYADIDEFSKDVTEYQIEIGRDDTWKPDLIEIKHSEIAVFYEAWLKSLQDLSDNETLSVDEKSLFDSSEMRQLEVIASLSADNGVSFTAVELLFKLHNLVANKELGDAIFFEGLKQFDEDFNSLPTYYLYCGS